MSMFKIVASPVFSIHTINPLFGENDMYTTQYFETSAVSVEVPVVRPQAWYSLLKSRQVTMDVPSGERSHRMFLS